MKPIRSLATVTALVLTAFVVNAGATLAVPPQDHNCLSPSGLNLNELFGISERIIGPPACRETFAGERWVRSQATWATAASAAEAVYPEGYTPAQPNSIDDFNAKFAGARFVHDRGTAQERSFTFGPEILRTGFVENGLPFSGFSSPAFHALSVGEHTTTVFVTMSAEHCDGLVANPDENCLPAGEFQWTGDTPFQVFPRRR